MLEQKLRRQLRHAVILAACVGAVLLLAGLGTAGYLHSVRRQSQRELAISEAEEYRSLIHKQIQAGFETLSALSVFIGPEASDDFQSLASQISQAQRYSDFINVVYFNRDGKGIICGRGNSISDASLDDLSVPGRFSVEQALSGKKYISQLFDSEIAQMSVFSYSVPVYSNEELIGALAASDHIDIFSDILSGNTVLGGKGYIHMIDSQGNFLIRSSKAVVREKHPSIFEGPYLSQSSRTQVQAALDDQQQLFSTFRYEGHEYPFLLEPVGINNWYLFCVNTGSTETAYMEHATSVIQGMLAAVTLLLALLMIYGYHLLQNSNRELLQLAYRDPLTGAENMARFSQRLISALEEGRGCVAAMNLRQFPFLTEIFGRKRAEGLLCRIKEILEQHMENNEFFCRDTEDRFYLFLRQTDPEAIRTRLEKLSEDIEQYPMSASTDYRLAVYCGVTIASEGADPRQEAEDMLTRIHFALDKAQGGHSSTIWFFDRELHRQEELENYIESHMQSALVKEEFKLYLQPKIRLADGSLAGAEALVRWYTSDGRMVYPNQFIPLFERNGFCVELDLYMVEQACRQLKSWMDQGLAPVPISVNQSKLLFFQADYIRKLTQLLETYQVSPSLIILEILEGLALENVEELNAKIIQLQTIGFRVSLDDFGSGYSSLNTLGKLQIDEIKLDRAFLLDAADRKGRVRLIMEETVRMARRLGLSTVAEGVETPEDEQLVRSIGCDVGQGYLYSRPLAAEDFDSNYMVPN